MLSFLNIDCDFFYDTADDCSVAPGKRQIIEIRSLLDKIIPPIRAPLLCLDHHEVLADWDRAGVRGMTCVHLDAHHDLFANFNRAWELPLGIRGTHVGVGDYLFHSLREGVVSTITWVCPQWIDAKNAREQLSRQLGAYLASFVNVISFDDWRWSGAAPEHSCICLSPEWTRLDDIENFSLLAKALGSGEGRIGAWRDSAIRRYSAQQGEVDPLRLRFVFPGTSKR
jgi:hypothetical protein